MVKEKQQVTILDRILSQNKDKYKFISNRKKKPEGLSDTNYVDKELEEFKQIESQIVKQAKQIYATAPCSPKKNQEIEDSIFKDDIDLKFGTFDIFNDERLASMNLNDNKYFDEALDTFNKQIKSKLEEEVQCRSKITKILQNDTIPQKTLIINTKQINDVSEIQEETYEDEEENYHCYTEQTQPTTTPVHQASQKSNDESKSSTFTTYRKSNQIRKEEDTDLIHTGFHKHQIQTVQKHLLAYFHGMKVRKILKSTLVEKITNQHKDLTSLSKYIENKKEIIAVRTQFLEQFYTIMNNKDWLKVISAQIKSQSHAIQKQQHFFQYNTPIKQKEDSASIIGNNQKTITKVEYNKPATNLTSKIQTVLKSSNTNNNNSAPKSQVKILFSMTKTTQSKNNSPRESLIDIQKRKQVKQLDDPYSSRRGPIQPFKKENTSRHSSRNTNQSQKQISQKDQSYILNNRSKSPIQNLKKSTSYFKKIRNSYNELETTDSLIQTIQSTNDNHFTNKGKKPVINFKSRNDMIPQQNTLKKIKSFMKQIEEKVSLNPQEENLIKSQSDKDFEKLIQSLRQDYSEIFHKKQSKFTKKQQ